MSLRNLMRIRESASNNHAAGTKYQEHFQKVIFKCDIPVVFYESILCITYNWQSKHN